MSVIKQTRVNILSLSDIYEMLFMKYIKEIETTWEDFLKQNNSFNNEQFIFRGQTNDIGQNGELNVWPLISIFNRVYSYNEMTFNRFLSQHFQKELFNYRFGKYTWVKEQHLNEMNLINKLIFLQHYGIPTCLIDFTYDPEIALYFALTSLKVRQVISADCTNRLKRTDFRDDYYMSLYRINTKALLKLKINEIKECDDTFALNYDNYLMPIREIRYSHIGLILSPEKMINAGNHYNLEKQKSCFVLYDTSNLGTEILSLDKFIDILASECEEKITEPIVLHYKINWNSALSCYQTESKKTLIEYLRSKNKTGKILFNDFQGLKYDLRFFWER